MDTAINPDNTPTDMIGDARKALAGIKAMLPVPGCGMVEFLDIHNYCDLGQPAVYTEAIVAGLVGLRLVAIVDRNLYRLTMAAHTEA